MSVLMKPSSVEWIGDVPDSWNVKRIKDVTDTIKTGKTPPSKDGDYFDAGIINWFTPGDMGKALIINDSKRKVIQDAVDERLIPMFKVNTVLLVGIGATVGKVAQIESIGSCNQQINGIFFNKRMHHRFGLYYMLHIGAEIQKFASFVTLPIFTQTETQYLKIAFPSYNVQHLIANFLDKSTATIENAIKTKQAQLKTLEALKKSIIHKAVTKGLDDSVAMKDSGIEWIGEIPEHWKIERLKDLSADITGGGTPKSSIDEYWEDGDIIWMTPTDFQYFQDTKYIDNSQRKITEIGLKKCSAKLLPINTVVMTSRASIGTPKLTSVELSTNQGFISFLPSFRVNNNFLYYCIDGYLGAYFQIVASGTTFMEISPKIVKQEKIPLPLKNEQKLIVDFLDKEVEKIDTLKSNVKNQINKLKEYKKSLIYEYVTGKKQVKE